MNTIRGLTTVFLLFLSLQSYALIITYSEKNFSIEPGNSGFSVNMLDYGYNPRTDIANNIKVFLSFREIVNNGDDWDAGTWESVTFYGRLWGFRELTIPDVSTETIDFSAYWRPGEDTCVIWDVDACAYDPVKSGGFGISLWTWTTNLALDEVRWELDITRAKVNEPSAAILLILGLVCLRRLRSKI